MPFPEEPGLDELEVETDRLQLRLVDESDAKEVYALLTHPGMSFLDPRNAPPDEAALRESFRIIRDRAENGPAFRRYQWVARRKDTGEAIALITKDLSIEPVLNPHGPPSERRVGETTIYVHADRQGDGYGPEAGDALRRSTVARFALTTRRALIRYDNERSQLRAAESGMTKHGNGMNRYGYETWQAELGDE